LFFLNKPFKYFKKFEFGTNPVISSTELFYSWYLFLFNFKLPHQYSSDYAFVWGGIFPAHFFGREKTSFSDRFKRWSENMKHTFGNSKDLILC